MHPAVFSDLSFDEAIAKAKDANKLLLVDATASWCQPCKHMDRTTWVDGNVIAAIGERAVAIQFDVDLHQELAKKLSVRAMPTVIAFRDGAEIDRIVGMRAPAAFVAWLEALGRGETSLDVARAAAREKPGDAQARILFAKSLLEHEALDEATKEHEALWKDLDANPAHMIVKHAIFEQQLAELIERHAPAREAFVRLRDAAPKGSRDWLTLNRALKETDETIAWFESVRDRLKDDAELASVVEAAVVPLLIAANRWADAGAAFVDPMKTVTGLIELRERAVANFASLPPDQAKQGMAMLDAMSSREVMTLRRALSAAGRTDDLRAVDEAAAKVDPSWVAPLPK